MALATFGLIVSGGFAIACAALGFGMAALLLAAVAVTALVDLVVVARRRRARQRDQSHRRYSMFE
jgi:membrane protein implicated in regulation of membrane protease activity